MAFDPQEVSWPDCTISVLGAQIKGLRGFSYKKATEKEVLYAAGKKGISIQAGNEAHSGSLKLLKFEIDKLNDAAVVAGYDDILDVPYYAIVVTIVYRAGFQRAQRTTTIKGLAFTEYGEGFDQNAKFMEIEMPYIALDAIKL